MIDILDFNVNHIEQAEKIALLNYNEERAIVSDLPAVDNIPDLTRFAENNLGIAAFDNGKMLGFLCCFKPWDNAFKSTARGTFSPIHAHGAVKENRGLIYKRLYEAAAEKWVKEKIIYHAIALYSHDSDAVDAFFTYGFGMRCIDAIRSMEVIDAKNCDGIIFRKLPQNEPEKIRSLRRMLLNHLGCSPCFLDSSEESFNAWIVNVEKRDTQIFAAFGNGEPIAYIEIAETGENFATKADDMLNICGAFCLSEFRGRGVYQNLLNDAISTLKVEGYTKLGVDFESFNPTAAHFWLKYFTPYTKSVVRRIDECAIRD